jgi:hypothetical protein
VFTVVVVVVVVVYFIRLSLKTFGYSLVLHVTLKFQNMVADPITVKEKRPLKSLPLSKFRPTSSPVQL